MPTTAPAPPSGVFGAGSDMDCRCIPSSLDNCRATAKELPVAEKYRMDDLSGADIVCKEYPSPLFCVSVRLMYNG